MKKTWVSNFKNQKKAEEIALKWNREIETGERQSPKGSHYVVDNAPEKDKKLPINKDCPNMKAVYFVDPTAAESETGKQITNNASDYGMLGWTFSLTVKSNTIVWTKEMVELIQNALKEVPDIEGFALAETYGDL